MPADKESNAGARAALSEPVALIVELLLAALAGGMLAAEPLLHHPAAYYRDDMQAQYMPAFYAIGHTLRASHSVPLLTTRTWFGGNLAGEFQYAVYNPIALALYWVLPSFSTLEKGAAFLAVVYSAIFASGAFLLARNLGISRGLAFVAALAISSNQFVFYWYASSWFPGLVSMAFATWAMAFLLRAGESARSFLGAGVFVALTATAGWPHTLLLLALFAFTVIGLSLVRRDSAAALPPALATALGFAASLAAIVPVLASTAVSNRASGVFNHGFLTPDLGDVLSFVNPLHRGRMVAFGGYGTHNTPMYYAAWFAPASLCLVELRAVDWRAYPMRLLCVFSAVNLVLSWGPEQIGPLRWPFRFLPGFQIGVVLLSLLLLMHAGPGPMKRRRAFALAASLALVAFVSWQSDPADFSNETTMLGCLALASALLAVVPSHSWRAIALAAVTIGVSNETRADVPVNSMIPDWNFRKPPANVVSLTKVPRSYELYLGGFGLASDAERFDEFLFGQMPLSLGRSTVNGYSPIGHRALADRFCMTTWGAPCGRQLQRVFESEPETGVPFLDLMRVNRIVVERGEYLSATSKAIGREWRISEERKRSVVYRREPSGETLPGSVSFAARGLILAPVGEPLAEREAVRVVARRAGANRLVFARAWWPGYHATFDGVSVPVRALGGYVVAVDLPAAPASGTLELTFQPDVHGLSRAVSIASLLGMLGIFAVRLRRERAASKAPPISAPETEV